MPPTPFCHILRGGGGESPKSILGKSFTSNCPKLISPPPQVWYGLRLPPIGLPPFGLPSFGLTPIGLGLPPFGRSINGGSPNDVSPNGGSPLGGSLRVSPNGVNPCYLIRQRRLNYIHIY